MNRSMMMLTAGILLIAVARPAPAEMHVWAVGGSQRVLRADAPGTAQTIDVAAARNEWRGFQIMLRSDQPVPGITLQPGAFSASGKPVAEVRLYRQHQLQLTQPSTRNKDFKPGWYPDPLIPCDNPLTGKPLRGGALVAQPFDLPANETHGFWIDLHVLPGAPAGEYKTNFVLTAPGEKAVTIPANLKVWDFALPAVPAMQSSFGSPAERMHAYYAQLVKEGKAKPVTNWDAVETQCAQLLAEHRINATPPTDLLLPVRQADGTFQVPDAKLKELARFIDRYHVNVLEVSKSFIINGIKDPVAEREKLAARLKPFDLAAQKLNRPNLAFCIYLLDEPNDPEAYAYIRLWGKAIRDARSAVKVMVTEQTDPDKPGLGDLHGAVDIWCPLFPLFDPQGAAKRQALGETIWAYTALCQRNPTPWWQIDYPLLNYRVPSWIAWRYRIRGLLYWGGMSYWRQTPDPWNDPWTYGHKKTPEAKDLVYNGEGTLVYPGRVVGFDGIAPSLRLKALRDGIQDYDYLAILEQRGLAAEADKIVQPLAESWFKWNPDPAAYDRARAQLAELIVRNK